MKELKTRQDIINLIGNDTVLKFDYMSDRVAYFKSLTYQDSEDDDYHKFVVAFFYDEYQDLFCYDTLDGFLKKFPIYQVHKVYMSNTNNWNKVFEKTFNKYKTK